MQKYAVILCFQQYSKEKSFDVIVKHPPKCQKMYSKPTARLWLKFVSQPGETQTVVYKRLVNPKPTH